MITRIYHQIGFRHNWNFESLLEDNCGDGLILAPKYMKRDSVENLPGPIKGRAIFDPQFFLPDTPKSNLASYDFFPDVASGGFETEEFLEDHAAECAQKCVDFQLTNEFYRITIPGRRLPGAPSDFIEHQQNLFIEPFLKAIRKVKNSKPVLLQLIVNGLMLKEPDFIADILNWVSSLDIQGVYLIAEREGLSKQRKDPEFLLNCLSFIDALKANDLEVVLGYLNTESVLFLLADPDIITIGAYENMRSFDIRTFEESENKKQMGPNPRLYFSQLLQWIEYPYVTLLKKRYGENADFFDRNKYQVLMFQKTFKWHFQKPELYKHYFIVMANQLQELGTFSGKERYEALKAKIQKAMARFKEFAETGGIIFEPNSDGSHLPIWLSAANLYADGKGWR